MKEFDLESLSEFNGKDGRSVYIAHRGRIIDVRPTEKWDEHSLMLSASVGKPGYHPKESPRVIP